MSVWLAMAIAGVAVGDWLAHLALAEFPALTGHGTRSVTGWSVCALGLAAWLLFDPQQRHRHRLGRLLALVPGVVGALSLSAFLNNGLVRDWQLPPFTATCMVLQAVAIALLDLRPPARQCPGQWLSLASLVISLLVVIGYSYEVPLVYRWGTQAATAVPSAIGMMLIAIAVIFSRPRNEPVALFSADNLGGYVGRRVVPAAVMFPLLWGWLLLAGLDARLYDVDLGVALFCLGTVIFFSAVTASVARTLGMLDDQRAESAAQLAEATRLLEDHATNLERLVAERTSKLTETVAELERFSYSLSHDLRAPLRAMKGFAQMLQKEWGTNLTERAALYLERISSAAGRLDQLIEDVLTYSRISRSEITLAPVDADGLVRQIIAENPSLQRPRADVIVAHPLLPVLGHEAYLTQALSNLLFNAVKFVAPGTSPHVRVWAELHERRVRLNIRDNGIGIPPDAQGRLFGLFERLNTDYEGTGVGLSIVRKAVERMHGVVGVESQEGRGSTFWLELDHPARP